MRKLYYNGTIITMHKEKEQVEAILTKDGKIEATGSYQNLKAQAEDAIEVDLKGCTLLPAFIDAHSHFSGYASSTLQVPLEEAVSTEEIIEAIQRFITQNEVAEEEWIIAKGYDHNKLKSREHISCEELDRYFPKNPIILQHQSGHVAVLNTAALNCLGITVDTEEPEGGRIGKKDGRLTGYLEENAYFQYQRKVPVASMEDFVGAYQKAQERYASYGITTIQEGMMVEMMIPLYQFLLSKNLLKLDLVGYMELPAVKAIETAFEASIKKYNNHLKVGGLKIFLDGSPQGRTAWMQEPYQGETEYCGYNTMSDEAVLAAMEKSYDEGLSLLAHCNGDAAAEQFLRMAEQMEENGKPLASLRPVMIHAQLLRKDQLARVKHLGIIPSFFVAHVYYWGDTHIHNFGKERASQISVAASALEQKIPFTFHQDAPVIEPNMLETVWCAVNRVTKEGVVLGEKERISVYEALLAVTLHAAYQYGEEAEKGSLEPGKYADFVILDQNPLAVEPEEIRKIQVQATIKRDCCIYTKE